MVLTVGPTLGSTRIRPLLNAGRRILIPRWTGRKQCRVTPCLALTVVRQALPSRLVQCGWVARVRVLNNLNRQKRRLSMPSTEVVTAPSCEERMRFVYPVEVGFSYYDTGRSTEGTLCNNGYG